MATEVCGDCFYFNLEHRYCNSQARAMELVRAGEDDVVTEISLACSHWSPKNSPEARAAATVLEGINIGRALRRVTVEFRDGQQITFEGGDVETSNDWVNKRMVFIINIPRESLEQCVTVSVAPKKDTALRPEQKEGRIIRTGKKK